MEKDKVYISGAIAHYNIDERKGAFLDAENRLRAMGFNPVNPLQVMRNLYILLLLKQSFVFLHLKVLLPD